MTLGVFASGRGSNVQAILDAIQRRHLPARVSLLVSNKADAGALTIARSNNIPAVHVSPKHFPTEDAYVERLLSVLREHRVDFIALAGYLKHVPAPVVRAFRDRILNVHPALLPAFGGPGMYGHRVHEAVIASGVQRSGATVHLVDEEYDRGPVVLQESVDIAPDDTPDSLAAKVLAVEHRIYPDALKAFAEGRVHMEGRRVWLTS